MANTNVENKAAIGRELECWHGNVQWIFWKCPSLSYTYLMPLSSKQFHFPKTWFFLISIRLRALCHRPIRLYNVSYLIRRKYAPSAKSATGQLAHLIEILSLSLGATNLFVFQDQTAFPPPLHLLELRFRLPRETPHYWAMCRGDVCLLYNLPCSQPASHFIQPINTNRSDLYTASLGL